MENRESNNHHTPFILLSRLSRVTLFTPYDATPHASRRAAPRLVFYSLTPHEARACYFLIFTHRHGNVVSLKIENVDL